MSSMTESLLLQAQSLRLEGELDASIDLLRVVLSQCNSDLHGKDYVDAHDRQHATQETFDGSSQQQLQLVSRMATTRRLRTVAAYQLALLLLQRSGRQTFANGNSSSQSKSNDDRSDEVEADELLWKSGYRLRLSNMAFGYSSCNCHRGGNATSSSTVPDSVQLTKNGNPKLVVFDDALSASMFQGLQKAFRPDSRYWSDFYCRLNNDATPQDGKSSQKQKSNQFASHNIPLPVNNSTSLPTKSLLQHLQQSKSVLEQVAIVIQHKLKDCFPEVMNATSVEVWSHRRPPDGQHQLHYDMDEILLYNHRKECTKHNGKVFDRKDLQASESKSSQKDSVKRLKTGHATDDSNNKTVTYTNNNGISCPVVSCVLTIQIPRQTEVCSKCGDIEHTAPPTIVCEQSIVQRNGNKTNTGYLCYPRPNRLLAFEGSLLHGVVPGIPFATSSASDDEGGRSSDDDFYGFDEAEQKQASTKGQRVTLMLGFWKKVRLTNPNDALSTEKMVGPNVPFHCVSDQAWAAEFDPISFNDASVAHVSKENTNSDESIDIVNPLWVSVNSFIDESFGEYTCNEANQFYGRFFLKSTKTTAIDDEVLSGS